MAAYRDTERKTWYCKFRYIIKKYRSLDEDGKGAVKNTLDFECKRAQGKSDESSTKTIV